MAHGGFHGQVGTGGGGSDPAIPECPVCHAYGGGGHGGFCPNMHEPDPSRWVTLPPPGFTPAQERKAPPADWRGDVETRSAQ